jgi:hypothetical protein
MFAKSGIIVTTVAAGLVALSPLAYAACKDNHHDSHGHKDHGGHHYVQADYHHNNHGGGYNGNNGNRGNNGGDDSCKQQTASVGTGSHRGGGLINVSNNTVQIPIQACNNNILSNIGLGILGSGHARSH